MVLLIRRVPREFGNSARIPHTHTNISHGVLLVKFVQTMYTADADDTDDDAVASAPKRRTSSSTAPSLSFFDLSLG